MKRKQSVEDLLGDRKLPLPLQCWLWKITSPFIVHSGRSKPGAIAALRESSCREFEVVLVQGRTQGKSAQLCQAFQEISRWRLIQAAFPHVMHCGAEVLREKLFGPRADAMFDSNEIILLYTLHWIIQDAASECQDADNALHQTSGSNSNSKQQQIGDHLYLHTMGAVQLFVYLFAPLVMRMREEHMQILKLENGLPLWRSLWEYRQPDVALFSTPVKSKRKCLRAQRNLQTTNTAANTAHIYLGRGSSFEKLFGAGAGPPPQAVPPTADGTTSAAAVDYATSFISDNDLASTIFGGGDYLAPRAEMSEICPLSTLSGETGGGGGGDGGGGCVTGGVLSLEVVCEMCNSVVYNRLGEFIGCKCKSKRDSWTFTDPRWKRAVRGPVDRAWIQARIEGLANLPRAAPPNPDILSASHFDVAVLRCLFCPQWSEDGVFWAVKYVHKRLLECVQELSHHEKKERARSHSLPLPHLTPFGTTPSLFNHMESPSESDSDLAFSLFGGGSSASGGGGYESRRKKMKSSDLKDKIGRLNHLRRIESAECDDEDKESDIEKKGRLYNWRKASLTTQLEEVALPTSNDEDVEVSLSSSLDTESWKKPIITVTNTSEIDTLTSPLSMYGGGGGSGTENGGTGPFFSLLSDEDFTAGNDSHQREDSLTSERSAGTSSSAGRPNKHRNRLESYNKVVEHALSDADVRYNAEVDRSEEVAGSIHYIQANGNINYAVVLKGIHWVANDRPSTRVCEVIMNIVFCLLDLDVIPKLQQQREVTNGHKNKKNRSAFVDKPSEPSTNLDYSGYGGHRQRINARLKKAGAAAEAGDRAAMEAAAPVPATNVNRCTASFQLSHHGIAMDTILKIIRCLGCSHGCNQSYHGETADLVRSQIHACLLRLYKLNCVAFRQHLEMVVRQAAIQEIVELLHALTGFCMDPATHTSPRPAHKSEGRAGYANSFGQKFNGEGTRNAEGIVIANLLKPFVRRLVECRKELLCEENLHTYSDVRDVLAYLKEVHGNTFRRTLLFGLMEAVRRRRPNRKKVVANEQEKTLSTSIEEADGSGLGRNRSSNSAEVEMGLSESSRTNLFKKKKRSLRDRRMTCIQQDILMSSSTLLGLMASDSEILEDNSSRRLHNHYNHHNHQQHSPRNSMSEHANATDDHMNGNHSTPRKTFSSKMHVLVGWRRGTKSDLDDTNSAAEDGDSEGGGCGASSPAGSQGAGMNSTITSATCNGLISQLNCGSSVTTGGDTTNQKRKRMSFRTAGQATLGFLHARRRIEENMKERMRKSMLKKNASIDEESRTGASDAAGCGGAAAGAALNLEFRERRRVSAKVLREGMQVFSFVLDTFQPGSLPEPQLVAAMLDLEAPVIARATFLLECSYFVHRCSRGDWPAWMTFAAPSSYLGRNMHAPRAPGLMRHSQYNSQQRLAGRMFHAWAEALGARLEYFLRVEQAADRFANITEIHEEARKRQLQRQDENEDFMDDATVNETGDSCPYALKAVSVQLLLEITKFLRETLPSIPKSHNDTGEHCTMNNERGSTAGGVVWERQSSQHRFAGGRLSAGSPVSEEHSSQESPTDIITEPVSSGSGAPMSTGRRISFAFGFSDTSCTAGGASGGGVVSGGGGGGGGSGRSSVTSLDNIGEGEQLISNDRRTSRKSSDIFDLRRIPGRKLLKNRRGSGQNSSIKRGGVAAVAAANNKRDCSVRQRLGSIRLRKISTTSAINPIGSDASKSVVPTTANTAGCADEDSNSEFEATDDETASTYLPWLGAITAFANRTNFVCEHVGFCHPNCYERQQRQCRRLLNAVRRVYSTDRDALLIDQAAATDDVQDENDLQLSQSNSDGEEKKMSVFRGRFSRKESVFPPAYSPRSTYSTNVRNNRISDLQPPLNMLLGSKLKEKDKSSNWEQKRRTPDHPMINYLDTQVYNLTQNCFSLINKTCTLLSEEHYSDMMPVAWELLLETDPELTASAAVVFLLSAIKIPERVQELMVKELQHEDVSQRMNAVLRFRALWVFRCQMWPRLEVEAAAMKIPPPNIEFVLPSPTLGLPGTPVVDAPWMPRFKASVEELQLNQDQAAKTFMSASTTRRKQQHEVMERAMAAEEERRRSAREAFNLMTVPINIQAAYEPALFQHNDEHEEDEEGGLASTGPVSSRPMEQAHGVFPSSICGAVVPIIHLLDDMDVNADGIAVCEIAEQVVWLCLVEDATLFLRYFLEKLTRMNRKEELICVLRKLIFRFPEMPAQTAHTLFNYILGYIMFYVRTPAEGGQEAIAGALSILWLVVPNVQDIHFKDLKQTLRKEQCDPMLMVTANMPSAKKVVVFGPDLTSIPTPFTIHEDTQFGQILEESIDIFHISEVDRDKYFLCDAKSHYMHNLTYYVRDFYFFKRHHNPELTLLPNDPKIAYKQLQQQALSLKFVEMGKVLFAYNILRCTSPLQMPAHVNFLHEELSKLPAFPRKALEAEFSLYDGEFSDELQGLDQLHKMVWCKLIYLLFKKMSPSFLWGQDMSLFLNVLNGALILHSEDAAMLRLCLATYIHCCQHFKTIFSTNGYVAIIPTILRVYNLSQDNDMVTAALEFACRQFYTLHRTPFILQLFGSIASNIDLDAKADGATEFYKIRPATLYRLLSAIATDLPDKLDILSLMHGGKPLRALDFCYADDPDTWSVVEAVNLCVTVISYAPDSFRAKQMLTVLQAIMPLLLKDIPKMAKGNHQESNKTKAELQLIQQLGIAMKQLLSNIDSMNKQFAGYRFESEKSSFRANNTSNHNAATISVVLDERDDSPFKRMDDGRRPSSGRKDTTSGLPASGVPIDEDSERRGFVDVRESYLQVACDFLVFSHARLEVLRRDCADRLPDPLDNKSHCRLVEVAHSLLKVLSHFPQVLSSGPLLRYMVEVLPLIDWSQETMRQKLEMLLRRLDKIFNTINKKPVFRRYLNWESSAGLLESVYRTLKRHRFMSTLANQRTFVNVCVRLVLSDSGSMALNDSCNSIQQAVAATSLRGQAQPNVVVSSMTTANLSATMAAAGSLVDSASPAHQISAAGTVPSKFSAIVVKLMALQMTAVGEQFSLETVCGGCTTFPTQERTVNVLANILIPLLLRCASGKADAPTLHPPNQAFAVTLLLHSLLPPDTMTASKSAASTAVNNSCAAAAGTNNISAPSGAGGMIALHVAKQQHLSVSEVQRSGSVTHSERSLRGANFDIVYKLVFLGLKIIMVAYPRQLIIDCHRVVKSLVDLALRNHLTAGLQLWKMIDFIVTNRPAIYVHLLPFIRFRMMLARCDTQAEHALQALVGQKLAGAGIPSARPRGAYLAEFAGELRALRDEQEPRGAVTAEGAGGGMFNVTHRDSISSTLVRGRPGSILSRAASILRRNPGQRIGARDGNKCLDRYANSQAPNQANLPVPSVDSLPSQEIIEEQAEDNSHRIQRNDAKSRKTFKKGRPSTYRTMGGGARPNRLRNSDSLEGGASIGSEGSGLSGPNGGQTVSGRLRMYVPRSSSADSTIVGGSGGHDTDGSLHTTSVGTVKGKLRARHQPLRSSIDSPIHAQLASGESSAMGSEEALLGSDLFVQVQSPTELCSLLMEDETKQHHLV